MARAQDDYEAGLEACLQQHKRLSGLDSHHELLKYADIPLGSTKFAYNEALFDEAARRFAQDGSAPKGTFAQAFMLARYSATLKQASDKIEEARR